MDDEIFTTDQLRSLSVRSHCTACSSSLYYNFFSILKICLFIVHFHLFICMTLFSFLRISSSFSLFSVTPLFCSLFSIPPRHSSFSNYHYHHHQLYLYPRFFFVSYPSPFFYLSSFLLFFLSSSLLFFSFLFFSFLPLLSLFLFFTSSHLFHFLLLIFLSFFFPGLFTIRRGSSIDKSIPRRP